MSFNVDVGKRAIEKLACMDKIAISVLNGLDAMGKFTDLEQLNFTAKGMLPSKERYLSGVKKGLINRLREANAILIDESDKKSIVEAARRIGELAEPDQNVNEFIQNMLNYAHNNTGALTTNIMTMDEILNRSKQSIKFLNSSPSSLAEVTYNSIFNTPVVLIPSNPLEKTVQYLQDNNRLGANASGLDINDVDKMSVMVHEILGELPNVFIKPPKGKLLTDILGEREGRKLQHKLTANLKANSQLDGSHLSVKPLVREMQFQNRMLGKNRVNNSLVRQLRNLEALDNSSDTIKLLGIQLKDEVNDKNLTTVLPSLTYKDMNKKIKSLDKKIRKL